MLAIGTDKLVLSRKEQLILWANGHPYHITDGDIEVHVPDFSCCHPELLAPPLERQRYMHGDELDRKYLTRLFSIFESLAEKALLDVVR